MAKQRYINTRFWKDGFIRTLDRDGKLLFLYFLSNPLTDLCGAYEITLDEIVFDTGIPIEKVTTLLASFEAAGKIMHRDGWVIIRNFTKHQHGTSTKIKLGAARSLNDCPDWVKDTVSNGIWGVSNGNAPRLIEITSRENSNSVRQPTDIADVKPSATPPTDVSDHRRGMRVLEEVIGTFPDGGAQGKALKWMLDKGATVEQIETELKKQFAEYSQKGFRTSYLTLQKTIFQNGNGHKSVGCDVCLNHPDRDMITVKGGGYICDRQAGTVVRCACNPKNGTA